MPQEKLSTLLEKIVLAEKEERFEEGLQIVERVLGQRPDNAHAWHLRALLQYRQGRDGSFSMERSLALGATPIHYLTNACEIFRSAGNINRAREVIQEAQKYAPNTSQVHFNAALLHYEHLDWKKCVESAGAAISLNPTYSEAHFLQGEGLLLGGQWAEGWEKYEWRFKLAQAKGMMPESTQPIWQGEPLSGPLLIVADQGFGDCIQFSRLIPWAAKQSGQKVKLACSAELLPILGKFPGVSFATKDWSALGEFSALCALSGLPRLTKLTPQNIPFSAGYLKIGEDGKTRWAKRLKNFPAREHRVAISWAGRDTHKNDKKRSMALRELASFISENKEILFFSIQKGPPSKELRGFIDADRVVDLSPELYDFGETAGVLANVDRLISVDTSVAHLAGAMGIKTDLLLPYAPDWRWGLGGTSTPWYDSVRLLRQTVPFSWKEPLAQL